MQLPRAYRLAQNVVMIALASVAPSAADAQADADVGAAVRECRRVQNTLERLDCYDRAFPPAVDTGSPAPQPGPAAVRDAGRAQIVDVTMPTLTTTVLVAADGRVFMRESTTVMVRWPATPFDVNIETSRLGNSTYLIHPRTGERVRVVIRD
jgi:hypothetical protein